MFTITEYQTYRAEEVLPLYAAVGWTNYTENPDMLRRAFANSLLGLAAWEGERLLGILRCVGYGASVVFLQDLLVYPERQRQGVGTALFQAMLGRFPAVYQLELLTDATSCAMCRRQVINAGLKYVVIRKTPTDFQVVDVEKEWVEEDDSLPDLSAILEKQ